MPRNLSAQTILPLLLLPLTSLVWAGESAEPAAPSVEAMVQTARVEDKSLNVKVHGYGTATFGADSVQNVNFPRPVQINALYVTVGQEIIKNQRLLDYTTDAAARMAYKQAVLAAQAARDDLHRSEALFAKQLSTNAQVAAARRTYRDSEAALAAQKAIGSSGDQATYASPFDGVVTALNAGQGDRLMSGVTVLQIAPKQNRRLNLGIEAKDVAKVSPGMAVNLSSILDADAKATGTVATVSGLVNPQTQLVDVVVTVASGNLLGGSKVTGDIIIKTIKGPAVPREALLNGNKGDYIVLVRNGLAKLQTVKVLAEDGAYAVLESGVPPGTPVIVKGHCALEDGMHVAEEKDH